MRDRTGLSGKVFLPSFVCNESVDAPMKIAIIATSLNPDSRSRILARVAREALESDAVEVDWIDLSQFEIPLCDGGSAYGDPVVQDLNRRGEEADAILMAVPIYNFDINAAAKNLIELTGRSWTGKAVGFLCAAGGQGSYMSVMAVANSLMLDFRCVILPRFVFATGDAFHGDQMADPDTEERVKEIAAELARMASALKKE